MSLKNDDDDDDDDDGEDKDNDDEEEQGGKAIDVLEKNVDLRTSFLLHCETHRRLAALVDAPQFQTSLGN